MEIPLPFITGCPVHFAAQFRLILMSYFSIKLLILSLSILMDGDQPFTTGNCLCTHWFSFIDVHFFTKTGHFPCLSYSLPTFICSNGYLNTDSQVFVAPVLQGEPLVALENTTTLKPLGSEFFHLRVHVGLLRFSLSTDQDA